MTVIVLQRGDERKELLVECSLKFSGILGKLAYQGWQVVECRGEGKMADHIRASIADYNRDKEHYVLPIVDTVRLGAKEAGADYEKVKKQFKKRFGVKVE